MIHIPSQNKIGGGWSFANNLSRISAPYDEAEVYLIPGATMVERSEVERAKADGKKIVLRVDNHLLPSRNRNTGMSRLKGYAEQADLLVYQSEWARDYLKDFTKKDGIVIMNGTDTELFKPSTKTKDYVYARSSRINEKGWEMARYWFSRNGSGTLNIVGKFSYENLEYNFDFYNGETFRYYGLVSREALATLLSSTAHFLYSYFMDACSNTLIEALVSGCEVIDVYGMLGTGGAPEIMNKFKSEGREYFSLDRVCKEYEDKIEDAL